MKFIPDDVFPQLNQHHKKIKLKKNQFLDESRIQCAQFVVGSFVYKKIHQSASKLDPLFIGPFKVVNVTKVKSYILRDTNGNLQNRAVHISHLKPAHARQYKDQYYTAECILNHSGSMNNYEFLIKWKELDSSLSTWEPQTNIADKQLISAYFRKIAPKRSPLSASGGG